MRVSKKSTVQFKRTNKYDFLAEKIRVFPLGPMVQTVDVRNFYLPMNDSLPKVANLFSWKDLLDIIFLLDCSIMQPLRFQHDDRNPINQLIKVAIL